jgi:hypothetical protein
MRCACVPDSGTRARSARSTVARGDRWG